MKKKKFKFTSSRARFSIALGQQFIIFSILLYICMIVEKHTGFKMTDNYKAAQIILCCMVFVIPFHIINGFVQEKINQKNSIRLKSLLMNLKNSSQICQVEQLEDFKPDIRSKKNNIWFFWQENVCYLAGEKGCIKLDKESWLKIINKHQKISEIYIKEIENGCSC